MGGDFRFKYVGFVVVVIIAGLALILFTRQFSPQLPFSKPQSSFKPTPFPKGTSEVIVELNAVNGSNQGGGAKLTAIDGGKTEVALSLKAIQTATSSGQPAYIRTGTCKDPGEIVTALIRLKNGESKTELTQTIDELIKNGNLIITVHKPATDTFEITACGELKKS